MLAYRRRVYIEALESGRFRSLIGDSCLRVGDEFSSLGVLANCFGEGGWMAPMFGTDIREYRHDEELWAYMPHPRVGNMIGIDAKGMQALAQASHRGMTLDKVAVVLRVLWKEGRKPISGPDA